MALFNRVFNTGRVGPIHRGFWDNTEQYRHMDTVVYIDGGLYINKSLNLTPIGTLPTDTDYWLVYLPRTPASLGEDIAALGVRATALESRSSALESRATALETKVQSTVLTIPVGITYTLSGCHYFVDAQGIVTLNIRFGTIVFATGSVYFDSPSLPSNLWPTYGVVYSPCSYSLGAVRYSQDCAINTAGTITLYGAVGTLGYYTASIRYATG